MGTVRISRWSVVLLSLFLLIPAWSCQMAATRGGGEKPGSEHPARAARRVRAENKEKLNRFMKEVVSEGNLAVIDELLAEDFVEHQAAPGMPGGREGVRQWFEMMRTGFPDLQATVDQMAAEEDLVFVRSTWKGTHQGDFMGIAPTGKTVEFQVFDLVRMRDGKAVEHWGVSDDMGLMTQLGVMSPPGAAGGDGAPAAE